ncbi:hypothetical protein TNCV_4463641 [Trichonephila clavipes]|nr:hypothetical protein TNCV_4463641 [Trichonephila clavipes]
MRTELHHPGVPPPTRSPTWEAQCAGHLAKNQARRLPEVHPEYNATASGKEDPTVPIAVATEQWWVLSRSRTSSESPRHFKIG